MNEATWVLDALHARLRSLDANLVGSLQQSGEALTAGDGRVVFRAQTHQDPGMAPQLAHCHIIAEFESLGGAPLDACVMGIHEDRKQGLELAAQHWMDVVAAPVFSLLNAAPVLDAVHFDGSQIGGVTGCHGFVGPTRLLMFDQEFDASVFNALPWYEFVAEMAPSGIAHLAKVTVNAQGPAGWTRSLEVDGHAAAHVDAPWGALKTAAPQQGIASQFAVFHYADQQEFVEKRQQLDQAIAKFVEAFQKCGDTIQASEIVAESDVATETAHALYHFVPLAFGRILLDQIQAPTTSHYVRITAAGDLEEVPLMGEPVFARSRALGYGWIYQEDLSELIKQIGLASPEFLSLNEALHKGQQLEDLEASIPVVPDADASTATVQETAQRLSQQLRSQSQG